LTSCHYILHSILLRASTLEIVYELIEQFQEPREEMLLMFVIIEVLLETEIQLVLDRMVDVFEDLGILLHSLHQDPLVELTRLTINALLLSVVDNR
jgi:hypothetical protein